MTSKGDSRARIRHDGQLVPDAVFAHPRLASIYDHVDGNRDDLDHYLAVARELEAGSAVDVGCGTGTFACQLAASGVEVTAVDPAEASLEVAKMKPNSDRVNWILGTVVDLPPRKGDMAMMTGNVAQVFIDDDEWLATLTGIAKALRPRGHLVFEIRNPDFRAWEDWDTTSSPSLLEIDGVGVVEHTLELVDVALPLVSFRETFHFQRDDAALTSNSTLIFRTPQEIVTSLSDTGYVTIVVRDAPDRPGREHVFIAQRIS